MQPVRQPTLADVPPPHRTAFVTAYPAFAYDTFPFASAGTSTLVEPTSLISTVVVRSMSMSLPPKLIWPLRLYSYLLSCPSFTQNLTVPLALVGSGGVKLPWPPALLLPARPPR